MKKQLTLTGDANIPDLPMTEAQVNHMRRLLSWLSCEYMLDDDRQRGLVMGLTALIEHGSATTEEASDFLEEQRDRIKQVPIYVRQAVRMLNKALRDHDAKSGIVEHIKEQP